MIQHQAGDGNVDSGKAKSLQVYFYSITDFSLIFPSLSNYSVFLFLQDSVWKANL